MGSVASSYAEDDERVNEGVPALEDAMRKVGKTFQKLMYPGTRHSFLDDERPDRYAPEAASQAWQAMLEWFKAYVRT